MKRSFRKFETRLFRSGLHGPVHSRALGMHVSLRELYDGPGTASIAAARRDVYGWLLDQGKSVNEVARIFDRAPSGVLKLVRKSVKKARGKSKTL